MLGFEVDANAIAATGTFVAALASACTAGWSVFRSRKAEAADAKAESAQMGHAQLELALKTQQDQINWQGRVISWQQHQIQQHQDEISSLRADIRLSLQERDALAKKLARYEKS